ncbi:peptidoglycan recognition protein [Kitasatospora sp. NPDC004723]|uniref:peptidoglycan recognition protein family protein n=1 Tax=Kitasatospora sp. NPDC004723 TaxID=3154288 RepID=UPI00339FB2AA
MRNFLPALRGRPTVVVPAALLAVCAAVLPLSPAAAESGPLPAGPSPQAEQRSSAGGGTVSSLPLTASHRLTGSGSLPSAAAHTLAPRRTGRFELLGVTWDGPASALDGAAVRVRTRDAATGAWRGWQRLDVDGDEGPDTPAAAGGARRAGTAPLWTGPSDGVAVEVTAGPAGPPSGLRVELVDPGRGAESSAARSTPAEPAAGGRRAAGNQAPRPGIVTRAGWGADESIREPGFVYTGQVRAVFIHHTATATAYECSDAPRVIRSIYLYHVQSNGWRDIGYNFLVDRCGTVYEGRAGGTDLPVHGAHTLGFNTDTAGVAAIGTYVSDAPPPELLTGLSRITAWKLGLTGRDAAGQVKLVSGSSSSLYPAGTTVTFDAVSGHRDGVSTECPGAALYAKLPDIRSTAAGLQGRVAAPR